MKKEHFLDRLNVLRKDAFASFNYDQVPDEFEKNESIPIECFKHGTFYQKPIGHLYGGKCPSVFNLFLSSLHDIEIYR